MKRFGYVMLIACIALVAIIGTVLLVVALTSDRSGSARYRLRAETMIPVGGPVDSESLDCPSDGDPSPLEFSPTGALAEELAFYQGELIAVRITLSPLDEPVPESVTYDASWPDSVVVGSPTCAYLTNEGSPAASLSWEPVANGATFTIDSVERYSTSVVEVWLTAGEPVPQTPFWTTLTTSATGDGVAIEPLGGRVVVDERPGGPAQLELEQVNVGAVEGSFEVAATVSNPSSTTRVLDASLVLEADDVIWAVPAEPESLDCVTGANLVCQLDDLLPGEETRITIVGSLLDDRVPLPVVCRTNQVSRGVGVCVSGSVPAVGLPSADVPVARVLAGVDGPSAGPLTFVPESAPVVVRSGVLSNFVSILSTSSADIAAVEIVDSDCLEIVRGESPSDDGDAFLGPSETWRFSCLVELLESTVVRIDLAAVDRGVEPVSVSVEIPVSVVDPDLGLSVVDADDSAGAAAVAVTNLGIGDLFGVAVTIPDCGAVDVVTGSPERLLEGESVLFTCRVGRVEIDLDTVTAYATDAAGLPVRGGDSRDLASGTIGATVTTTVSSTVAPANSVAPSSDAGENDRDTSAPTETTVPPAADAGAGGPSYPTLPDGRPKPIQAIYDEEQILVSGPVPSEAARDRVLALALANSKSPTAEVVDLLTIDPTVPLTIGVRVTELDSVRFPANSAVLSPAHAVEIDRVDGFKNALPETTVEILGHSDQRGTAEENYAMSSDRALAVAEYLVANGISPLRVSARAIGESELLTPEVSEAALALNRRTEFIFYGLLEQ